MENVIIRRATLNDLHEIQNLNNLLFKLEKENFDPTLIENWPITEEGKEYFKKLIEESHGTERKKLYTKEGQDNFNGNIIVPDDLETINVR